jgi:enamine deaminase RidA (YjgF/YER057c/UK114 family)
MMSSNPPANKSTHFTTLRQDHQQGLYSTTFTRDALRELHLTLVPQPAETMGQMLQRLSDALGDSGYQIVKQDVFGPVALYGPTVELLKSAYGKITWPVMWVDGSGCGENTIGGMHVTAVAGTNVESVSMNGRVVGTVYQDGHARNYLLGDLRPAELTGTKPLQTSQTYEMLETALGLQGMNMTNVVRTWFFLDDILSWYDDFNLVRNAFYTDRKLIERLVPASTGVGVKNPFESALVLGAWGVEPTNGSLSLNMLPSPLQCPAPQYGSCFSRGVEIVTPGHRRVLVSGTASIHPGGESAHFDDMTRQVELTMEVIAAILATRKLTFADTTRATAFIKVPKDAPAFLAWCRKCVANFPAVVVEADVCRDELLFELELDAMAVI